ncbi:MAG TPA: response regulator [Candidatus Hydrogenedentes bacterium]|nr:response regulator [Candidatus Hydrogenedentota bacterium]
MGEPRILIVDDEEPIRRAVGRWLAVCGFDVDTADDGDVAVAMCREKTYDAVTLDLEMPRMNGIDAMTAIKKSHPNLPIIVLTGLPNSFDETLLSHAARILTKPIRLRDLETEIRQILAAT